ncbi:hypothetical protein NMY22_g546 [Coprinellus aureogranulatus]|nr:hypothetical protein NMY22_g546 [Coprinellus aureogranulatus]
MRVEVGVRTPDRDRRVWFPSGLSVSRRRKHSGIIFCIACRTTAGGITHPYPLLSELPFAAFPARRFPPLSCQMILRIDANPHATGMNPFVSPFGVNAFEEFTTNFCEEVLNDFVLTHTFSPSVGLTSVLSADIVASGLNTPDALNVGLGGEELLVHSGSTVEMLRGPVDHSRKLGGVMGVIGKASSAFKSKAIETRDADLVKEMGDRVGSAYSSVFQLERDSVLSPSSSHRLSNSHHMATLGGGATSTSFTVQHFAGPVTYTAQSFVEKDADLLDASFVTLLRSSSDPFIAKLVSGPGLATERHAQDPTMVVSAQVSSARPMRSASLVFSSDVYREGSLGATLRKQGVSEHEITKKAEEVVRELEERGYVHPRMDPGRIYGGVCADRAEWELDALKDVVGAGNPFAGFGDAEGEDGGEEGGNAGGKDIKSPGTSLFVLHHIRPNDSGSPNSFDKRRVKAQLKSLGLSEIVKRVSPLPTPHPTLKGDWTVAIDGRAFCKRYVGRMRGTEGERVRQCARSEGWREGVDYVYVERKARELKSISLALGGDGTDGRGEKGVAGEGEGGGRRRSLSVSLSLGGASAAGEGEGGRVWLTYDAWKSVEDHVRAAEKGGLGGASVAGGTVDGHDTGAYEGYEGDDATTEWGNHTSQGGHGGQMLTIPSAYGMPAGSQDNLLGGGAGGAGERGYGGGGYGDSEGRVVQLSKICAQTRRNGTA